MQLCIQDKIIEKQQTGQYRTISLSQRPHYYTKHFTEAIWPTTPNYTIRIVVLQNSQTAVEHLSRSCPDSQGQFIDERW